LLKLKTEVQTTCRKPHLKVTKLKSKLCLFLGYYLNQVLNTLGPGAMLLGWPKSIY